MASESTQRIWDSGGAAWSSNQAMFDQVLAPFADALMASAAIRAGERVLDVGCGAGAVLERIAQHGATPVGVDISKAMVAAARARVPHATVLLGDAQTLDFDSEAPVGSFDRVVSRFGVMFFDDPVAAFANIGRAAKPAAALTFICFRPRDNPMATVGIDVLTAELERHSIALSPAAHAPWTFGDPERMLDILTAAGWRDVAIEPFDGECDYSTGDSDGIEERLTFALATSTGEQARADLETRLGAEGWAALLERVRADLRRNLVDGALKFTAATWIVTAVNAG